MVGSLKSSTVFQSYSQGTLKGNKSIGGLIGSTESNSIVVQSYAAAKLNGSGESIGGLVGEDKGSDVKSSYWDVDTSGQKETAGNKGEGHSAYEMTLARTYKDWDFDKVWKIQEGETYPRFEGDNTRLDEVTLTFIGDGKKEYVVTALVGSTLNDFYSGEIPEPTKSGHTLDDWETEDGKRFDMDTKLGDKDLTLTPKWKLNEVVTKTFYPSEEGVKNQTKDIEIDDLYELDSYDVDKGKIDLLSRDGGKLKFELTDRPYDRRVQTGGEEILADSKTVSAQNSSNYNKDGYTGNLSSYVYSGGFVQGPSKYVTNQGSSWYNSGGYSGTLSSYSESYWNPSHTKYVTGQTSDYYSSGGYSGSLSSYVYSGSYTSSHSKNVSEEDSWGYTTYGKYATVSQAKAEARRMNRSYMGRTKNYNSGGYRGTLTVTSTRIYDWGVGRRDPDGTVYGDVTGYYTYTGRVTRPESDTRVYRYRGNVTRDGYYSYYTRYQGTVYMPDVDTRVWRYKGTVNRPYSDTRTWDNFYQYGVTVSYIPK